MDVVDPFKLVFHALDDYKRRYRTVANATVVVHPRVRRAILTDPRYIPHCGDTDTICGHPLAVSAAVADGEAVVVQIAEPELMVDAVELVINFWRFLGCQPSMGGVSATDMCALRDAYPGTAEPVVYGAKIFADPTLPRSLFWVQIPDRRLVVAVRPGGMEWVNVIAATPPAEQPPQRRPDAEPGGRPAEDDICDEISALVDEQMAPPARPKAERCMCGFFWHGLPITEKMEEMRRKGAVMPGYNYATDKSRILCPGTPVVGIQPPGSKTTYYI